MAPNNRAAAQAEREAQIQHAITYKDANPTLSVTKIAYIFNIPQSTLQHRINGREPPRRQYEEAQRLTPAEEASLLRAVQLMTIWGWPMRIRFLTSMATQLLIAKGDMEPLGQH